VKIPPNKIISTVAKPINLKKLLLISYSLMISNQRLKSSVHNLLKNYGLQPSKKFGQNFLIDQSVINKLIKVGDLKKTDIVLEIGPGTGILTKEIAKRVKKVIAIEKDRKMCQILQETLRDFNNIEIIQRDILNFQFSIFNFQSNLKSQFSKNYKIIANLPFYLTGAVIRKFLEVENKPKEMILIVQKEVAQRINSRPPQMNLLAVAVQFYAQPKIIDYISKKSFWPQPEVDGAIIKLQIKNKKAKINEKRFFEIVKAGFSHPRKTILNNLSKACPELAEGVKLNKDGVQQWLLKNNLKPCQRAESLSLNDWLNLSKNIKAISK